MRNRTIIILLFVLHQRSVSDTHLRTRSADEPREAVTVTCVQGPVGVELSVGIALAAHEGNLKTCQLWLCSCTDTRKERRKLECKSRRLVSAGFLGGLQRSRHAQK